MNNFFERPSEIADIYGIDPGAVAEIYTIARNRAHNLFDYKKTVISSPVLTYFVLNKSLHSIAKKHRLSIKDLLILLLINKVIDGRKTFSMDIAGLHKYTLEVWNIYATAPSIRKFAAMKLITLKGRKITPTHEGRKLADAVSYSIDAHMKQLYTLESNKNA